ncbi:MAG: hypothetical protein PVJ92_00165 [Candidatus Dependentiae bacterium]|jgi:hypothetical protein
MKIVRRLCLLFLVSPSFVCAMGSQGSVEGVAIASQGSDPATQPYAVSPATVSYSPEPLERLAAWRDSDTGWAPVAGRIDALGEWLHVWSMLVAVLQSHIGSLHSLRSDRLLGAADPTGDIDDILVRRGTSSCGARC